MSDDAKLVLYIVGLLAIGAGSVWLTLYAPCGWFMYGSVKNMPARCVGELVVPGSQAPSQEGKR